MWLYLGQAFQCVRGNIHYMAAKDTFFILSLINFRENYYSKTECVYAYG